MVLFIFSNVNFTSSAVKGWPSCQATPGRSFTVHWVRSSLGSALVASQGSGSALTCDQKRVS